LAPPTPPHSATTRGFRADGDDDVFTVPSPDTNNSVATAQAFRALRKTV
jgi:hypothetical protein